MTRESSSWGSALLCSLLLTGCVQTYYIPNSHHVPLLTQKKDARAVASYYSTSRDMITSVPGFELQGSYAASDHVGLMTNFLHAGRTTDDGYFNTTYGDLGVGYFTTNASKKLVFEAYTGFGLGSANNGFGGNVTSSADYSKFFLQPGLGFKSRYFDAAFSWRWGTIHHSSITSSGTLPTGGQVDFDWLVSRPSYTISEPAITVRAGVDFLKLQVQVGWSVSSVRPDTRSFGSVGLFFTFPRKKDE